MTNRLGAAFAALLIALATASGAQAHPLGNFSVNHLDQVQISAGKVTVRYILDQAEIPTFQERDLSQAQVLASKQAEVARRLSLTVNGRAVPLSVQPGALISHPPGQGGLPLTRVEFVLTGILPARGSVAISDQTFPGRVGWKAIEAEPGQGTAVRSSAPSGDPTGGLRSYPTNLLSSPIDERTATFTVAPGGGTLQAPRGLGGAQTTTNRAGDGFAGVFSNAASGKGVLILLLLAAFGWGAVHALSPGHGKSMVAAYLVGARGTARHAVGLGVIVTVTHTLGVFALGAITLLLSQYILPDQLYPWLNLASGLLVVIIGGQVLRARIRSGRRERPAQSRADDHGDLHSHHQPAPDRGDRARRGESSTASHGRGESSTASHGHGPAPAHAHAGARSHGVDREVAPAAVLALAVAGGHERLAALVETRAEGHSHDYDGHAHPQGHDHTGHVHSQGHDHAGHVHSHGHDHDGHPHSHGGSGHSHELPDKLSWRSLIAMGASAGLIPCPSALVVLLGAIAQHQVALGLLMIVAFSVGLAFTLAVLGLAVVWMGSLSSRINFSSRLMTALPTASALVIVGVGCALTAQAIPKIV